MIGDGMAVSAITHGLIGDVLGAAGMAGIVVGIVAGTMAGITVDMPMVDVTRVVYAVAVQV